MSELWDLVDKLRPWPPLQYGLVFAIVVFSAITYFHVLRSKLGQPTPVKKPEVEAMLLFSGPFSTLSAKLDTLAANQKLNKAEMREMFAEALQTTRHTITNKMAGVQAEIKEDVERVKDEIRAEVAGARQELRDVKAVMDAIHTLAIKTEARRRS